MSACSRPGCSRPPIATLVYDYRAGLATLTDLVTAHPMQYDLCKDHADRMSVPKGWQLADRRMPRAAEITGRIAS